MRALNVTMVKSAQTSASYDKKKLLVTSDSAIRGWFPFPGSIFPPSRFTATVQRA